MESTGCYGDAMRHQFRQAGFAAYQASAKRVHDAQEIFDGVPSLHDAKAACLIAKLHRDGLTRALARAPKAQILMLPLSLRHRSGYPTDTNIP